MRLALLIFFMLFAFWACEKNTPPEEVARSYMQALAEFDVEGMVAASCPGLAQDIVAKQADIIFASENGMNLQVQELKYETVEKNKETAIVRMSGIASWNQENEEIDEQLHFVLFEGQWKLCEDFF